jgi:hypothetical protein
MRYAIVHWRYWFGRVDTRPVAIFRILLALLLLKDAFYHLFLARTFYSDEGILPRSALFDGLVRANRFSLMDAVGSAEAAIVVFVIWIVVLIALLMGYRARLMAILNYVLILSIHERNGDILTAADTVMRVFSFWLMFAPMNRHYAIDAVRERWMRYRVTGSVGALRPDESGRMAFALPVRMLQLQLVLIYACTGYLKLIGDVWLSGDVLHYVRQLETLLLPGGVWLYSVLPEWALKAGSYYALFAEVAIPILLVFPLWSRRLRLAAFVLALGLHGGIALTMAIPDFSVVMLIGFALFFEPDWLERGARWLRVSVPAVTLPHPVERYSPLWMLLAVIPPQRVRDDMHSNQSALLMDGWTVVRNGEMLRGREAWNALFSQLSFSRLWGWALMFPGVRRVIWRSMGWGVRHWLTVPLQAPVPYADARVLAVRAAMALVLIPLMVLVVWWNAYATLAYTTDKQIEAPPAVDLIWYSGLWQYWDMFAPLPMQLDGWLMIPGQFENGVQLDLMSGSDVDPERAMRWYWGPEMRWEKFEENVFRYQNEALLGAWGSYLCRTYNEERAAVRGTRLATLQIQHVFRRSFPPGGAPNAYEIETLWFHWCFDEYAPDGEG